MAREKWKLVSRFDVERYQCGLLAGDRLRLRSNLIIRDWRGKPTGIIHQAGEIWDVLLGSADDPNVVFLRQEDGQLHAWPNDRSIFETFARVRRRSGSPNAKSKRIPKRSKR